MRSSVSQHGSSVDMQHAFRTVDALQELAEFREFRSVQ